MGKRSRTILPKDRRRLKTKTRLFSQPGIRQAHGAAETTRDLCPGLFLCSPSRDSITRCPCACEFAKREHEF